MWNTARHGLFCLACLVAGAAGASDIATANQLLANKKYQDALPLFSKLAAAGDPEAQLRLGEMYWYGEGVALDRAKGDALFAQAAARGNVEAQAATTLSGRRAARSADLAYWTGGYKGEDLGAGQFACKAPAIPKVSNTNQEIKAVTAAINAWSACRKGYAGNIAAALPPGKAIPPELLVLMSEQEVEQARLHLDKVYAQALARGAAETEAVMAQSDAWRSATQDYVVQANQVIADRTRQAKILMERDERARLNSHGSPNAPMPRK